MVRGIAAFWIAIAVLVVLAGGLALAYFGFMAYLSWRMSSPAAARMVRADQRVRAAEGVIEAELERIKAAGQAVAASEIAPPPVPEAQNAARLYEKAFAATKLAADDRSALGYILRPSPGSSRERWIRPVRAVLAKNCQTLDLTYAAVARPRCRFPVRWEEGALALLPHPAKMRQLSRLVSAQAVLLSMDGDLPGALRAVRAGIALGDSLADEPLEVSQACRYRLYQKTLEALQVVLSARRVPAATGKPLYDHLAAIQIMSPFKHAAIGERAASVTLYQIVESNPEGSLGIKLNPVQKVILPPAWTLSAAEWLPLMGRRIALADQPYRAVRAQLLALDADGRKMAKNDADPVVQMVFFDFDGWASSWWEQRDMAIACIGLAQAALALKAYQAKNGVYPDSLNMLRRAVGWRIPQDPFSGRDFVYKREGEAAVIYSVGPDLCDNGGAPLRVAGPQSRQWVGDKVWRMPR